MLGRADGRPSGPGAQTEVQREVAQGHIPQLPLKRRHTPLTRKQEEGWDGNKVMRGKHTDDSSGGHLRGTVRDLFAVNSEFTVELGFEPTAHLRRGFLH